ncbi:hypothetical protein D3C80_2128940 [compost metagenome]
MFSASEDVEAADGRTTVFNHAVLGVWIVRLVVVVLGVELLGEEGVDGRLVPRGLAHLKGAGGRV